MTKQTTMTKQIETIICVECPYCDVKILKTFVSDKKKTPEEIAQLEQYTCEGHTKLHEESYKYAQLIKIVRNMAEITGDLKHGA